MGENSPNLVTLISFEDKLFLAEARMAAAEAGIFCRLSSILWKGVKKRNKSRNLMIASCQG
jgi:hypothetical protein